MFPACAGMIPLGELLTEGGVGVPRMRGDDPWDEAPSMRYAMCSPHARG